MTVFLEFRSRCWLCGYRLRGWQCRVVRINKHSLRTTDRTGLGAYDRACPECLLPGDAGLVKGEDGVWRFPSDPDAPPWWEGRQ
jgi:hypothetical protein